jgi:hypothetical protein
VSLTVADAVAVLEPSAGRVAGLKVTFAPTAPTKPYGAPAGAGLVVWSIFAEPLPPVADSVALIVHQPAVVDEI